MSDAGAAAGAAAGLGFGDNTRAGLITRSLAEMTRIGSAYGASPLTFLSLAGELMNRIPWKG
jgi:glycerol-3-phosphate dehydrogenase